MNQWFIRSGISSIANGSLVSALVIVGTFPGNEWTYSIGVDPPLAWVFDYLSQRDSALGRNVIFPHGPLAYFMYPLENNITRFLLVLTGLKILLVYALFSICRAVNYSYPWLTTLFAAYAFCVVIEFNQLLLLSILLLYCLYFLRPKYIYAITAFALTALAFYVKANVAVWSGVLFCTFNTYRLFHAGTFRRILVNSSVIIGLIVLFWLGIYHTYAGFFDHIIGELNLIQDNSSAAAMYPDNNWWLLAGILGILGVLVSLNNNSPAQYYWWLTGLNFFAMWKYAMSREDMLHIKELYVFLFTHLTVFLIFNRKRLYINSILSLLVLLMFYANMRNVMDYKPLKYEVVRVNSFVDFVLNRSDVVQQANVLNELITAEKKLPEDLLKTIGSATVDVYPYDYSILAANKLNWKPRIILHSYASYTNWLDRKNAQHFDSSNAPDFVLIEHINYHNVNNSDYGSVDDRYYPNDEPRTILEILKNYDFAYVNKNYLLLKKRAVPVPFSQQHVGRITTGWWQWISVPNSPNNLLRAKLTFDKSFRGALKSLVYKDEQFWVYMLLSNGLIHKYRIVPKNAATGLWINPYIYTVNEAYTVQKIMFASSSQWVVADELVVNWEKIRYADQPNRPLALFGLKKTVKDSVLFQQTNTFEQAKQPHWQPAEKLAEKVHTGKQGLLVKSESFSPQFTLPLDSLSSDTVRVVADCWINAPNYTMNNKLLLVLKVESPAGVMAEKAVSVDHQLIDRDLWNNVSVTLSTIMEKQGSVLKAYLWNTSKKSVMVDDFRITVLSPEKSD